MNLNDLFWDDLLLYLEQKQMIPIIGQDLLSVDVEGRSVNAYRLMVERFADELKISSELLPQDFTLSQVIAAYPRIREKRSLIYSQTKATFDRLPVSVPEKLVTNFRVITFHFLLVYFCLSPVLIPAGYKSFGGFDHNFFCGPHFNLPAMARCRPPGKRPSSRSGSVWSRLRNAHMPDLSELL
jgi:hypothetical protein